MSQKLQVAARGWLLAAGLFVGANLPAHAEIYTVPIIIDSEDDLFDLFENGDISESEMDLLMELYQKKVDLNRATRDELYELPGLTYPMVDAILQFRREKGDIKDVRELEKAGAVPYIVMKQMEAFVLYGRPKLQLDAPVHGSVRLKTLYQPMSAGGVGVDAGSFDEGGGGGFDVSNIRRSPSVALRSRITAMGGRLDASWTISGRDLPGRLNLAGTPDNPYYIADSPRFRLEPLRKAYAMYSADLGDQGRGQVVVGTYNAGFGERLTFDSTNRRRPYGLYGDDLMFDNVGGLGRFNSDFRVHRGLQGVAGSVQQLPVAGRITLDTTGFLSMRAVDEYMYRYRPNRTYFNEEAAAGGEARCTAEGRCHSFETFRDVYVHQVGGGNMRLNLGSRSYIGSTAYAARNYFTEGDEVVNFAPAARQPVRRSFGAFGIEGAYGTGIFDLFGEFTVTDRGAPAALIRTLYDLKPVALEVTGRYYDKGFDNPFSRGEASAGQFLGMRARDEAGLKVRAEGRPARFWRFIGHVDSWIHPAQERHDLEFFMRHEFDLSRKVRLSGWVRYFDKDIWVGGRDQDYIRSPVVNYDDIYDEDDPDFAMEELRASRTDLARGLRKEFGNQMRWQPSKRFLLTAYGRMVWRDVSVYDESFERNVSTWIRGSYKPVPWLDLSSRVRFWDDDIDTIAEDRSGDGVLDFRRGNAFLEVYGRVAVSLPKRLRGSFRYDVRTFTDVKVRDRDPEHLLRLTVEAFF
ncbi:MAG: hypothetical protein EA397_10125 [Deltaproteobacteria bacterium]|nr:MAG: hypothetical protein EA397_10125 [Deltaproteobacteria bacterium]